MFAGNKIKQLSHVNIDDLSSQERGKQDLESVKNYRGYQWVESFNFTFLYRSVLI